MDKFETVSLTRYFNSPARLSKRPRKGQPRWVEAVEDVGQYIARGSQTYWGIPFKLGPADLDKKGLVVVADAMKGVEVPLRATATHVCILHFCDARDTDELPYPRRKDFDPRDRKQPNAAGGEHLADYVLRFKDGSEHVCPIRRRFEVSPFVVPWGAHAFAALSSNEQRVAPDDPTKIGWGYLQTGFAGPKIPVRFHTWVYALENPHPQKELASIRFEPRGNWPIGVLGLTLYRGPGHPLRHVPRRVYRLVLPAAEKALPSEVEAELDMGYVTRVCAVPEKVDENWLKAPERGLGTLRKREPSREFLLEATGAEGATVTVKVGRKAEHHFPFGKAFHAGKATSIDGKARLELLHPGKAWVHVEVVDASTGKPTPTRIHFCGPNGEYLPPYGHHAVVNDKWFEDYAADLQLGGTSFAYVPGRFQIELPVGEVFVEANKGFEYVPMRKRLEIRPGQRELKLAVNRKHDLRSQGWITADTHVHFISPETAWLEGQAEGLNLINLLASQWGRLFTNVGDISGKLSGCSRDETLVWVGTENRHHLLGHISLLGTHGDPVFPMCAGGQQEAYFGDPDVTTLTEWAERCRQKDGVVIRPHFPYPICEEPVYFTLGKLDGVEQRRFADPQSGSLDHFCFEEWYRYLNCGYRVAAVGGTDKMSAGMPVGGVRTYAHLEPDEPFNFENWGKAVRAGRTYTSSGPLLSLKVDGRDVGDEIRIGAGGAGLQVQASAECVWPMHLLEVVANGRVVAGSASSRGANSLSINETIRLEGSAWIAARCGSNLKIQHCWPIHLGAHTSPVYVIAGGQRLFSPSDATYMLTLIDGGMTYLDTLSVRFDEKRHEQMKAIFQRAKGELLSHLREAK